MKFDAPYTYEELIFAIDLEQGITVNKSEFLSHCYSYLDFADLSVDMKNSRQTAIVLLERFLGDLRSFELSNRFLLNFSFWYKEQSLESLKMHGHKRCVGALLDLCNVLMSQNILAEIKLYLLKTLKKMERLKKLSSFTRSCIVRYEKEGRYLKAQLAYIQTNDGELIQQKTYSRTAKYLGKRSIFDRIGRFIFLMESLGRSDIKEVTVEDLEGLLNKEEGTKTVRSGIDFW